MQLTIGEKDYSFKFGIGFVKKLDDQFTLNQGDFKYGAGLENVLPKLVMGDVVTLADVLIRANATESPKLQTKDLYDYIDDENTDIEGLFEEVLEELKNSNATKLKVANLTKEMDKQQVQMDKQQENS